MKRLKKQILTIFFALTAVMSFFLSACDLFNPPQTEVPTEGIRENGVLHASGEKVVDEKGKEVSLRGVNAGGLFVTENWMNGFSGSASGDYRTATKILIERFGEAQTKALWNTYRENWWSEIDFKNCADMGMTVIRLPFTYMNVDFAAVTDLDNGGKSYDFSALDAFVEKAADYGMYTILDLHGAYGSHNGQDHSGEVLSRQDVDFYTNEQKISLTEKLWGALAEHYKDNPAVAGYDILNEPGEKAEITTQVHFAVFDRLYDAIRAKDNRHMVIFESCWDGENLPHPEEYGWENCMYSFHHYTSQVNNYYNHCSSFNAKIENITSQNFGVPLQMGEFSCYNNAEQWEYTLNLLNNAGFHWCSWTYKINPTTGSPWGIYYKETKGEDKVNVATDEYETIKSKFALLKTNERTEKTYFKEGDITLQTIVTNACMQDISLRPGAGEYVLKDADANGELTASMTGNKSVIGLTANGSGKSFLLTYQADGSVYLSVNGNRWDAFIENGVYFVGLSGGTDKKSMKFYPYQTDEGTKLLSYATCRYLYIDGNGMLRADGTGEEAHTFVLKG